MFDGDRHQRCHHSQILELIGSEMRFARGFLKGPFCWRCRDDVQGRRMVLAATDFGLKSSVRKQTFGATFGCHAIRPFFALK
jgi:hypothetical protein